MAISASEARAEEDRCAPTGDTFSFSRYGTDRILKLEDWSAKPDGAGTRITLRLALRGDKPVRMVDGKVSFYDALDGSVGSYPIDRDAHIAPGKPYEQKDFYTKGRLENLKHEEVTSKVCVYAVLYEDGTKETFK